MSDDKVDKVDYYESFEIYKSATNRIIEKVRANRSFSFDDTPVDPRKLVVGHNIKDLKADGYTPKVKRLDFGVEQRKTKQDLKNEEYLEWCETWVKEIENLLEFEADTIQDNRTIQDIRTWLNKARNLRVKMGCFIFSIEKRVGKRHYLEASLIEKENALDELLSSFLFQRERARHERECARERDRSEKARIKFEELTRKNRDCILALHKTLLSYYYYHYEALGSDKLIYISTNMDNIKHKEKGSPESRVILNSVMKDFLGKLGGRANFEVFKVHHILDEMGETSRFNHIATDHLNNLYEEIDKVRDNDRATHLRLLRKMYNPKMFLNGIDDLRTTLKEMKDHGATKEEQEGRNEGEAKDS